MRLIRLTLGIAALLLGGSLAISYPGGTADCELKDKAYRWVFARAVCQFWLADRDRIRLLSVCGTGETANIKYVCSLVPFWQTADCSKVVSASRYASGGHQADASNQEGMTSCSTINDKQAECV